MASNFIQSPCQPNNAVLWESEDRDWTRHSWNTVVWLIHPVGLHWRKLNFPLPVGIAGSFLVSAVTPSGLNLCTLHTCCQFQWSSVLLYVEDRFLREIDHFWFLRSFPPSSFPETDPEPRGQGYDEDSPFRTVWSKASAHHQTVSLLVSLTIRKSCSDQSQSRHWPVSQSGVIFGIFETVLLDCHGWSQVCPQTWNSSVSASRGLPHYRHRPHAHLNHVLLFCI